DESLAKHKALELEIERLLRAVVSQDILSVVQNTSVVDTSNLQTELERTKERFESCIIKKGNEYAKLWNDWYKKCDECKFDKISYDKAFKDMQKKIERLQAWLEDLKGKSKDTLFVLDTLNPLSQKLENENVELEFQVIAPGMFRINPFKTFREEKHVPNNVRASARTKPIIVSQPPVFTKKDVNSDSNGLSSTGVDNTKTRRPQPRSNTKNDRVPSASKSSRSKNKGVEVEEHHRNLLLSKNTKHMSSACNNIKFDSQNVISKVVCAMLARLQRQEYEAHSAAVKHGFEFFDDTAALLHQPAIETRRNLVLAAGDPTGSIVSTGGVPVGSVPASGVPAGSLPASSVPAGGVIAGTSTVAVDPVATKRVNTIHPQSQIIRDLQSPVQTRSTMQKSKFGERAFISYVHNQNKTNYADHLHCLFACFLSQLEPSSVAKALKDPDWVASMQEEMQQFYHQQVWKLVPLPAGKISIETKWILKNKRDARGIVVRNKARLVAQGHSSFLYGEIEEEVYVTQPKGFEDPYNPKNVYRVVNALYGLHQAPRA
nr:hypothetical protein [Tanacetum cinerariifolium]